MTPDDREMVSLSIAIAALTVASGELAVILVEDGAGTWRLPEALLRRKERFEDAAARALGERSALDTRFEVMQLATYDDSTPQPGGRAVTVAFRVSAPLTSALSLPRIKASGRCWNVDD